MTTTNLGRVAIVPKGTYTTGTHKPLDMVRYNGASYIAKTTTSALPTVTSDWDLVASDGTANYTWVKYASDATGTGLTDSPTGMSYIGIAVNKSSATESTTATDYTWSLIKGDKGDTGATGPQGPAGAGGTVTSVAALTITTTGTDLTSTVANGNTTPVITINVPNASATARGVLTSTDWTTFNGKQAALVSGTNIKTVNGNSILGSGDITISGGVSTGKAIAMAIVFGG